MAKNETLFYTKEGRVVYGKLGGDADDEALTKVIGGSGINGSVIKHFRVDIKNLADTASSPPSHTFEILIDGNIIYKKVLNKGTEEVVDLLDTVLKLDYVKINELKDISINRTLTTNTTSDKNGNSVECYIIIEDY